MNKKFNIFYTIFASLVFIFAVGFFVFNLYNDFYIGKSNIDSKYQAFLNNTKKYAEDETTFNQNIKTTLNRSNDFAYIQILKNGNLVYLYPNNVKLEDTNSNFVKNYFSEFFSNSGKITISSNMYILKPSTIYYYAKVSFLIILIITLLTVFIIVYLSISKKDIKNIQIVTPIETDAQDNNELNFSENSVEIEESDELNESDENNELESTDYGEIETTNPKVDKIIETSVPLEAEKEETKINEDVKLPYEELKPVEIISDNNSPKGLFNPETGIGWESYLHTRLDNELNRAISSEFDLALFIIKLPGISKTSDLFRNICNYLSIQFQFKDLLFEYKEDCIVSMMINMNLDEALTFSEKLYSDLKNMLEDKECFIGISTRTIRMISGSRLLFEADQALRHAEEDKTSPVIAFRVDAEKYRQFFEHNQE